MMLVELVRLRRWSIIWCVIIALIGGLIIFTVQHAITTVDVNGAHFSSAVNLPLSTLAPIAMFLAMIYATSAGLSLNREGQTLALSWTKPVARPLIALRIMAVDLAAVVLAYVVGWLAVLAVVAGARGTLTADPHLGAMIALSLGVTVMWYALIQALTSRMNANTGMVIGLLWPVALLVSQLNGLDGTFDTIVRVINVFNPLAYLNAQSSTSHGGPGAGYWQAPPDERALIVWLLSCALGALAIYLWTRREA